MRLVDLEFDDGQTPINDVVKRLPEAFDRSRRLLRPDSHAFLTLDFRAENFKRFVRITLD